MTSENETRPRAVVARVSSRRLLEGGGFPVRRPFPNEALAQIDPFLLLDEMGPVDWGPGEAIGAPDHPHRGFETITYLLEGSFEHKDSAGHRGVLRPGDMQWMTAGRGVIHSELPSEELRAQGGRVHGFQVWVNLPRADKWMNPRYQEIPAHHIPRAEGEGFEIRVLAGSAQGIHSAVETRRPLTYLHFELEPHTRLLQELPQEQAAVVYPFRGEVRSNDEHAGDGQLIRFDQGPGPIELCAGAQGCGLLLLGAEPLREPMARSGPFVMNTAQEIQEAIADYRSGRLA